MGFNGLRETVISDNGTQFGTTRTFGIVCKGIASRTACVKADKLIVQQKQFKS